MSSCLLFDLPRAGTALSDLLARLWHVVPDFHADLLVPVIPRALGPAADRQRLLCPIALSDALLDGEFRNELRQAIPGLILRLLDMDAAMDMLSVAANPVIDLPAGEIVEGWSRAMRTVQADLAHSRRWAILPAAQAIAVAHIDTGITPDHPCFSGSAPRLAEGLNLAELGLPACDPWPERARHVDRPGHGTATASVLMASEDHRLRGVLPGANLFPIRLSKGGGLADALRYAMSSQNCDVVSLSAGGVPAGLDVQAAARALYEGGVIVCAAADDMRPPLPGTILVSGSCIPPDAEPHLCLPWEGAARDPAVTISAPALDVAVAGWAGLGPIRLPTYRLASGTGLAAAMVAGAAALWLGRHGARALKGAELYGWRRVEAFRHCLRHSARPWSLAVIGHGKGVLDIDALLDTPLPPADRLDRTEF